MKNLKRALSFALASVMLLGMMVVGAGAAEFKDADKIENVDAVNTLVALGIIAGKDTGDFDPEGIVTRAEMAKMICVAMNNGKDPNLSGTGLYPDTRNHWAKGYIDYCTNQGIVAGDTAGNFNPDKTVTGTEAAKMILIALGYNAESEKFVNDANWSININVLAGHKGLYEDVPMLADAGLTRDNAAQMIWNGLQAETVKYTMVGIINGNAVSQAEDTGDTLLEKKFDMVTKYGYMTGVSYDDVKKEYTYSLDDGTIFGLAATDKVATDDKAASSLKSASDYSGLFGMKVKTLTKTANGKTTVYGIYATDSEVLYEGVGNDLPTTIAATDDSVKLDGTTYKLTQTADSVKVMAYNVNTSTMLNAKFAKELAFQLIDNTGDGKADLVVTYPTTVAKVTFVGKDSITAGNISYKFEDCDIYEGVKKDDFAVITAAANTKNDTPVIAKAEILTGSVGATRTNEVRVDGTWYKDATTKAGDGYSIGDTFELVIVNGYVYNAKKTSATAAATDTLYVLAADAYVPTGTKAGKQTAEVLFADGSKKVITVDKTNTNPTVSGEMEDIGSNGGSNILATGGGVVYSYAIDKDGNYELKLIDGSKYDATKTGSAAISVADGKATGGSISGTFRFSDNAVVYVKGADGKVKALSGSDVNKWGTTAIVTTVSATDNLLYANTKNGFNYVELGQLTLANKNVPSAAGDEAYGWITATPSLVKDGDDYYAELKIWNGTDTVTVLAEGYTSSNTSLGSGTNVNSIAHFAKGTPISYKDLGSDKVSEVTSLASSATAITGYADGKDIEFTGKSGEIDDDTVILYVNTADNEGVTGGSLVTADKDLHDNYIKNAYADVDGSGKVTYIIIDTSNNLDVNSDVKSIALPASPADPLDGVTITGTKLALNGESVVYNTNFDLNAAAAANTKLVVTGSSYQVIKANGDLAVSTYTLVAGDTIRVVAEDGSFIVYDVVATTPV